jgi:hypothetical protein
MADSGSVINNDATIAGEGYSRNVAGISLPDGTAAARSKVESVDLTRIDFIPSLSSRNASV